MTPEGELERRAVTQLLQSCSKGDTSARERLVEAIYQELRQMARALMSRERPGHTLQATALVNEMLLKLLSGESPLPARNKRELMAVAAVSMRRLLVDHARMKGRARRGGGLEAIPLETQLDGVAASHEKLLQVNEALDRLKALDERASQVAELRIFAGYSSDEIGEILSVTGRTVERDWLFARAFLQKHLA